MDFCLLLCGADLLPDSKIWEMSLKKVSIEEITQIATNNIIADC